MSIYRGDIYYIENAKYFNVEVQVNTPGRPAIIVSNNKFNAFSSDVTVVFLTTKDDRPDLPVHVPVICKVQSTALCETVCKISQNRIGEFIRTCTDAEMQAIDKALMVQLGIEAPATPAQSEAECEELKAALDKMKAANDGYAREVTKLEAERERLMKELEERNVCENAKIKELEGKIDAMTAARESAEMERVVSERESAMRQLEQKQNVEIREENIRLKAEIDVYKALIGKLIPQLA